MESNLGDHPSDEYSSRNSMEGIRGRIYASPLDFPGRLDVDSWDTDNAWEPPVFPKSLADQTFLRQVLQENFIFMDLTAYEKELFMKAMELEIVVQGNVIIEQGATTGDFFFYIVDSGKVNFLLQTDSEKKLVGSCERGGSFGELALLYNSPRAVSCVAASAQVRLWKVDQKTFRRVLAKQAACERRCVTEWVRQVELFKNHLDDAAVQRFVQSMSLVHWKAGDIIVKKGDVGKTFYLIQSGKVKVSDIGLGSRQEDQILEEGSWFGERALLTGEARMANVTALTDMTTFTMDAETFEECIGPLQGIFEKEMRKDSLKSIPMFANSVSAAAVAASSSLSSVSLTNTYVRGSSVSPLTRGTSGRVVDNAKGVGGISVFELDQMANLMTEKTYEKNSVLVEAGNPTEPKLWIIRRGRVTLTRMSTDFEKKKTLNLQAGDYFGEVFILEPQRTCNQTAVCDEDCVFWILTRAQIEGVIGSIDRLGQGEEGDEAVFDEGPILFSDLTKHKILGTGGFGKVWLVSHKQSKLSFALKAMSKAKLIKKRQHENVMREKELLGLLEHPFILHLISSFQDENHLYLLLPLIPGGDLFGILHRRKQGKGLGLVNYDASFYAACVIEAIGHFHQRNIAYRDLKLENILIDEHGYCKIVDLGFAKVVNAMTYTFLGTAEYLAPEIIMSKGYDKAVDYWAYGILCYELLVGQSPFFINGSSTIDMFKRIVRVKYAIPQFVSSTAGALISKLLVANKSKRLGNLARGYLDVKSHPWFERSGINFVDLLRIEAKVPWKPVVKHALDSSNFDDFSDVEKEVEEIEPLSEDEQKLFIGF